jgi:hypothetical protein
MSIQNFRHDALIYESDEQFADQVAPFPRALQLTWRLDLVSPPRGLTVRLWV